MNQIPNRIQVLRRWCSEHSIDALIIPSADPHQGEYTPQRFQSRAYLSGFDGSAGTLVVTATTAGLWTDSRYFVAAEQALRNTGIDLHRLHTDGVVDYPEWLSREMPPGARVGVDARLVTVAQMREIRSNLEKREIELVAVEDPMESVWENRPPLPAEPVWVLEDSAAGEAAATKLKRLRVATADAGAGSHVLSTLDDIAWLLNLRGSDVDYNPVFLGYLTITDAAATLYTAGDRMSEAAQSSLRELKVSVRPYQDFMKELPELPSPVLIDPERCSWAIYHVLSDQRIIEKPQPSTMFKAKKNAVELSSLRSAMVRDGRAMVRFLSWLDNRAAAGDPMDEAMTARKLQDFRAEDPDYLSDSFNYISGFGANGAIVHYAFDPHHPAQFSHQGLYLIDSGAQYRDGTTDITRTVAIGEPTVDQREDFTLVLKGHIALSRMHFPRGTAGRDLDALARQHLWMHHRSYLHGTGHGVGFVLNVHEGPQKIAPGNNGVALEPGMVVSNEPGLYREGQYGIRIENLVAVQSAGESEFGEFYSFETLSWCPIDRRLIEVHMLTPHEREWVDAYHREVWEVLSPLLDDDAGAWLQDATAALTVGE